MQYKIRSGCQYSIFDSVFHIVIKGFVSDRVTMFVEGNLALLGNKVMP